MTLIIIVVLVLTILAVLLMLRNLRPGIPLQGQSQRSGWKAEVLEYHGRDLVKVTKYYRWVGLVLTVILVGTFLLVLLRAYISGFENASYLAAFFEAILFILVKMVFHRVDSYEQLVATEFRSIVKQLSDYDF